MLFSDESRELTPEEIMEKQIEFVKALSAQLNERAALEEKEGS